MSILQSFTFQELKNLLPNRAKDSHKGNFGKVLICAGSPGMGGAGILASEASLFCGSGKCFVAAELFGRVDGFGQVRFFLFIMFGRLV